MSLITKAVKKVEKEESPPIEQEVLSPPKDKKRMAILIGAGLMAIIILSLGYFLLLKPAPEPPRKVSRRSISARRSPVKPKAAQPQVKENAQSTQMLAEVKEPSPENALEKPIVPQGQAQEVGIVAEQTDKITEPEMIAPVATEELQVPQTEAETEIPLSILEQPAVDRPSPESGQETAEEVISAKGEDELVSDNIVNQGVTIENQKIPPEEEILTYSPVPEVRLVEKPLTVKSTSDSKAERYYNKGVSYQKQGNFNQAIDLYNKALQFNSDHVQARMNLATSFLQAGRIKEAEEQFNFLYFLEPNDYYILYNLGLLLYRTGDLESAELKLKKLLILDPLHLKANLLLGSVLEEMGNFKEAAAYCMKAYYIDSANPRVIYRAARAWDITGDEKKAIRYYRLFLNTGWENESGLRLAVRERLHYLVTNKEGKDEQDPGRHIIRDR